MRQKNKGYIILNTHTAPILSIKEYIGGLVPRLDDVSSKFTYKPMGSKGHGYQKEIFDYPEEVLRQI